MEWVPLDSSMFTSSAYEERKRILYLRFRESGLVYRYFDVEPETYADFSNAESHGRFFAARIRDKYSCEKMAGLRVAGEG